MKKVFLSTTLIIFFVFGLSAKSKVENKKVMAFIEKAKEYATQQEFESVAQYLQQAYDMNPTLLDCNNIQLLGVSYYMMEESASAIKFLELSAKCEVKKEALAQIYIYLSDSYLETGNYKQAVKSSEKAISNTTDDKDKSILYEELANIHYDNNQGDKTIESMQQSVVHYLKHLVITDEEVMRDNVKNEALGIKYFNLAWFASSFDKDSVMYEAIVKSALSGNKDAIGYCNENNIAYKDAIKMDDTSEEAVKEVNLLIQQADTLVAKEQYTSAISHFEKAHGINSTLFEGKTYHLMGFSYYMISKYRQAINYLERSLQFDLDKNTLYSIYGTLADAYQKQKNYTDASKNAEKALYLSNSDEDVLKCSLRLASIYYAQKNFDSTIDSFQNAIRYYMKIQAITEAEVKKGNVKDEFLAETHMKLAYLLSETMREDESKDHLIKAALFGNEDAMEILKKNKVKY